MKTEFWYLIIGVLLVVVTLTGTLTKRLPVTLTMLYLAAGLVLGPLGFGVADVDAIGQVGLLELLSELAVIVSLFTAGLKLRCPFPDKRWGVPLRLAFVSMALTVGFVAFAGSQFLGISLGAAVLLGAILAPTDPVLASDVQLESAGDQDKLRFGITGEAGFNDGTAFPFVMLGLGLLGLHELGTAGWKWLLVDVIWAVFGGLAIGGLLGTLAGKLVLYLRREHKEAVGRDEFLALGLIGVSYGAALAADTYGFLAVFAAGLALRNIERRHSGEKPPPGVGELAVAAETKEVATDPKSAPAYMAEAVLVSNQRTERLLEVALVLLVGCMIQPEYVTWMNVAAAGALLIVVRPLAVFAGLAGSGVGWREQALFGWFGIRGIGSIYYLTYSINHGLEPHVSKVLEGITLIAIALSVLVHGFSVTPLRLYRQRRDRSTAH